MSDKVEQSHIIFQPVRCQVNVRIRPYCKTFYLICVSEQVKGRKEFNTQHYLLLFVVFSGVNVCPTGSVNKTFKETFGNAKTFCEQVWNYSWKVVPDSKPCMKIWFTGSNPNDEIAKMKAMTMVSASTCYNYTNAVVFLLFLISLILS